MHIFNLNEIEFEQKRPGVFVKAITGKNMQLCYIRLEPGQVTNHKHIYEQMGYILAGEVELKLVIRKPFAAVVTLIIFLAIHSMDLEFYLLNP